MGEIASLGALDAVFEKSLERTALLGKRSQIGSEQLVGEE
jgi:hypothetical protein